MHMTSSDNRWRKGLVQGGLRTEPLNFFQQAVIRWAVIAEVVRVKFHVKLASYQKVSTGPYFQLGKQTKASVASKILLMLWCCLPGKGPQTTVFSKPTFHGILPVSKCSCVLQDLQVKWIYIFFFSVLPNWLNFLWSRLFPMKNIPVELSAELHILKCFSPYLWCWDEFVVVCSLL